MKKHRKVVLAWTALAVAFLVASVSAAALIDDKLMRIAVGVPIIVSIAYAIVRIERWSGGISDGTDDSAE